MVGLKQQIKAGTKTPEEALKLVQSDPAHSEEFVKWVKKNGKKRFGSVKPSES